MQALHALPCLAKGADVEVTLSIPISQTFCDLPSKSGALRAAHQAKERRNVYSCLHSV